MTDESDARFMRTGVFSCYEPANSESVISIGNGELTETDWRRLYRLAHEDRAGLYREHHGFYQSTHGQIYWSDEHQFGVYLDGYHKELDSGRATCRSEMISELYVPRPALASFLNAAREYLLREKALLIYGTVRLIMKEEDTFLAWARDDWACVIFNLCVEHSDTGLAKAQEDFRRLIDIACNYSGSYYLTYHRWATREQAETCHPRLRQFFRLKEKYDPTKRWQSDWHSHHLKLLGIDSLSER